MSPLTSSGTHWRLKGHQPRHEFGSSRHPLGLKSLSMTLVYARIADHAVAQGYYAVIEGRGRTAGRASSLPRPREPRSPNCAARPMGRTLCNGTGNGNGNCNCARPVELDRHKRTTVGRVGIERYLMKHRD